MRIAFEVQHRVDDVLEHARAGDRAFLGDVADEEHDDAALLGEARQLRRAFAHLRDPAGRRRERLRVDRLDRIDDDDFRRVALIAATIASSWISASSSIGALTRPSRCARSAICSADSSPVT